MTRGKDEGDGEKAAEIKGFFGNIKKHCLFCTRKNAACRHIFTVSPAMWGKYPR